MRSTVLISALLLCTWISVAVSEYHTMEVQPGGEVTLQCPHAAPGPNHRFWSRLSNRTRISCISFKYGSNKASFCEGFEKSKYEMTSNISTISLTIKQVDFSDSGLYLCGFYVNGHTILTVINLNVKGNNESHVTDGTAQNFLCVEEHNGITKLACAVLAVTTVVLAVVLIVLAVQYRKLQKAHNEGHSSQQQNVGSGDLNYATLSFPPKAKRNRRPPPKTALEPSVVFAATR